MRLAIFLSLIACTNCQRCQLLFCSISFFFPAKTMKAVIPSLLLCYAFLCVSGAESISLQPHALESFNLSLIQNGRSCYYTVSIRTSCSSPRYTRDRISLSFGDAYGNQIYVPRLDDPSTSTFESCSSDSFQITGPCAYQICYAYLYRTGPDGWRPESVKISSYNSRAVTFQYSQFIPANVWYGFNWCGNVGSAYPNRIRGWVLYLIIGSVALAIL